MNRHIRTVIIAPMTTAGSEYPTRIRTSFEGKKGQIALDQIRTVDKGRLVKVFEKIDDPTASRVLETLAEMFVPRWMLSRKLQMQNVHPAWSTIPILY